jgi:F-type H+-transporting ATPase subunit b
MFKNVRSEVASLALAAASKVIEANMDTESNRVLVNKFIDEAGVA